MPHSTRRAAARKRIKARRWRLPPVSIAQILAWADEHFEQTGRWPNTMSGRVRGTFEEKWKSLDNSLRQGTRGLRKGDSLAKLLYRARGVRNPADPPPLTVELILAWADEHHAKTGQWPIAYSGAVNGIPDETWNALDMALRVGSRGLPGEDSLARLLDRERGVPNKQNLPRLTINQILAWCDQYHARTGQWPTDSSEPLTEMHDRWQGIDAALRAGTRGLPGGDSLPQLLARKRGVRNLQALPRLTNEQILAWADDHHRRTGAWPSSDSGSVLADPQETWSSIAMIIRVGGRGLPGNDSLARLLARERGVRNRKGLPPYSIKQILAWADQYHAEHKKWPNVHAGNVAAATGETWTATIKHTVAGRAANPVWLTARRAKRGTPLIWL